MENVLLNDCNAVLYCNYYVKDWSGAKWANCKTLCRGTIDTLFHKSYICLKS